MSLFKILSISALFLSFNAFCFAPRIYPIVSVSAWGQNIPFSPQATQIIDISIFIARLDGLFTKGVSADTRYSAVSLKGNQITFRYEAYRHADGKTLRGTDVWMTLGPKTTCDSPDKVNAQGICVVAKNACTTLLLYKAKRNVKWQTYIYGKNPTHACYGDYSAELNCVVKRKDESFTLITSEDTIMETRYANFYFTGEICTQSGELWGDRIIGGGDNGGGNGGSVPDKPNPIPVTPRPTPTTPNTNDNTGTAKAVTQLNIDNNFNFADLMSRIDASAAKVGKTNHLLQSQTVKDSISAMKRDRILVDMVGKLSEALKTSPGTTEGDAAIITALNNIDAQLKKTPSLSTITTVGDKRIEDSIDMMSRQNTRYLKRVDDELERNGDAIKDGSHDIVAAINALDLGTGDGGDSGEKCIPNIANKYCENNHGLSPSYAYDAIDGMLTHIDKAASAADSSLLASVTSVINTPPMQSKVGAPISNQVLKVFDFETGCTPLKFGDYEFSCEPFAKFRDIFSWFLYVWTLMHLSNILLRGIVPRPVGE